MIPFRMRTETEMEQYRKDTFWVKEPETIAWIDTFKQGETFYDVGANIGVYSLYCASKHPDVTVIAFEPQGENFKALLENRWLNRFKNLHCIPCAIGDYCGHVLLEVPKSEAGATGAQVGQRCSMKEGVPILSIDKIREFDKPDHVKIDIDGQELSVLNGMTETLPFIKSILVEVSKSTKQQVMDILFSHGFEESPLNDMTPHSRWRRLFEKIDAENIIFVR